MPLQGPPANIDCRSCSHSILRGLVDDQRKMRRLGLSLLVVVSALAVLATFRVGKVRERTELFLHAGRTAYGPDGGYSPKTRRYPVDKSALAAYLKHQPKERLDRLASRRAQKVEDRRLERDSQPQREGAERRWTPSGAMGDLKRKSPGGSAAVRDAMAQYMQHQSEGARRREAIGAPKPRLETIAPCT